MALEFQYFERFKVYKREGNQKEERIISKYKKLIMNEIERARMVGINDAELAMDLIDKTAELYFYGYLADGYCSELISS